MNPNFNMIQNESQKHLTTKEAINLGSFYTPQKYIELAEIWLKSIDGLEKYTIIDPSCGYGAFLTLSEKINNRFIGNDVDPVALKVVKERFKNIEIFKQNKFLSDRESFKILPEEKLIIVGNPPYNDVTSQINAKLKTNEVEMSKDLKTRDLGMSSLRLYEKMNTGYALILHPLSYLIKESNFKICKSFFQKYRIEKNIVFSSQEFEGTSRKSQFPIIMALYKKQNEKVISFDDIYNMKFNLENDSCFSLSDFDYITDYVQKYPSLLIPESPYKFYTLRDINALKRSRTFVPKLENNCLYVSPEKLDFYCYIDCFKQYCKNHELPFWMGNLNIPFDKKEFDSISNEVVDISKYNHPEIFGYNEKPSEKSIQKVKNYIERVIKNKKL